MSSVDWLHYCVFWQLYIGGFDNANQPINLADAFDLGTEITFVATADAHYTDYSVWTVNGNVVQAVNNSLTVTIAGDTNIAVAFASVTAVDVTPQGATIQQGGNLQMNATVTGTNNPPQTVTWSVTGHSGASINQSGLLSVAANVPGDTVLTVRAVSDLDNNMYGEATVTVTQDAFTLILTPNAVTVNDGNLTSNSAISGTASGTITLNTDNLPQGVSVAVEQATGMITVTGVRPDAG